VAPDVLRPPALQDAVELFLRQGACVVAPAPLQDGREFFVFPNAPTDFDARALAMTPEADYAMRRWIRLSPRYLGPQARRVRSLACDGETAEKLKAES